MKFLPCLSVILVAALVLAATAKAEDAAAEKTKTALKTKVSLEFLATPLSEVVERISKEMDVKATWDPGLPASSAKLLISIKVKDWECGMFLDWVGKLAEVEFRVDGDHIEVTTPALLEAKKNSK